MYASIYYTRVVLTSSLSAQIGLAFTVPTILESCPSIAGLLVEPVDSLDVSHHHYLRTFFIISLEKKWKITKCTFLQLETLKIK